MVQVVFPDGKQDDVTLDTLDELIDRQQIISFQRSGRWVILGRDPLRVSKRPTLCIPERRRKAFGKFDLYLKSLTA